MYLTAKELIVNIENKQLDSIVGVDSGHDSWYTEMASHHPFE